MRPSPTPTPEIAFRGVVVFQTSPAGNSDIFLLNQTGASPDELFNLTNDPAQDTDPAWSPDGEWIAVLSDRSGKREMYVINVAGTRLTQMTVEPAIDWQGPLTWSADGKMIALAGRRLDQNNERWLYVVPLGEVSRAACMERVMNPIGCTSPLRSPYCPPPIGCMTMK